MTAQQLKHRRGIGRASAQARTGRDPLDKIDMEIPLGERQSVQQSVCRFDAKVSSVGGEVRVRAGHRNSHPARRKRNGIGKRDLGKDGGKKVVSPLVSARDVQRQIDLGGQPSKREINRFKRSIAICKWSIE